MLREGPIPLVAHGAIEYVVGLLFIAAPFLFAYDSSAATGLSVGIGVVVLVLAALTRGPTGLVSQIPVGVHVTLDFILAVFLVAAPFLFGFSGEPAPRNTFLVLGVAHLLLTIGTRFPAGAASDPRR